mmetsp:Transcript_71360/g.165017  ORF Transcript_71360/g.165017 Transcript_71360/m.165017 type:complete len:119 (+) Transcript_71360:320-676(+)
MGVGGVSTDFRRRGLAAGRVPRIGRLTEELRHPGTECAAWLRTRVVAYVEYRVTGPGGCLEGCETCENARHEVISDSRWLRAVTPPFNVFADRRTCCEFRFFDRFVEALARKGMAGEA